MTSKQTKLTHFLKVKNSNEIDDSNISVVRHNSIIVIADKENVLSSVEAQLPSVIKRAEEVLQINTTPPDLLSNTVSRTIPTSIKSFIFPRTNGRCFRVDWFQNFKWLEYSIVRDAAFCFPCRMFAPTHPKSKTFAITGFNSWKNALNKSHGFYKH
ncbi:hypothetical protein Bhyg_15838, partial [Pseudolycoriella hygida]